jgi:hypothetical protein
MAYKNIEVSITKRSPNKLNYKFYWRKKSPISEKSYKVTFKDVINLWIHSKKFRKTFSKLLADVPFKAYMWKCVSLDSVNKHFEFNVSNSKKLARISTKAGPYRKYFKDHKANTGSVISFISNSNDTFLVVPYGPRDSKKYKDLASFMRKGTDDQIDKLWKTFGKQVHRIYNTKYPIFNNNDKNRPLWLNTHGLGVYWLHLRIDIEPKNYVYDKNDIH